MLNREGRALEDAETSLHGVTCKADIADQRESLANPVAWPGHGRLAVRRERQPVFTAERG
ncbi:hypothetical protein ACGFJT_42395 [Actinomadura geliboluensis]|uniref:hypothetical protein n=1 Tax=Actinomadura geliboluensis TaxID=882440 RepID=UPI00371C4B8F